jgi:hypothetical protein
MSNNPYAFTEYNKASMLNRFNVNKIADPAHLLSDQYLHYTFMTAPDLNLFSDNGGPNPMFSETDSFSNYYRGHNINIISLLSKKRNTSNFIPFVTSRINGGLQVEDRRIRTIEKGNTFFGNSISYGMHDHDHRKGDTFSLEFRNDRDQTPLILHSCWADYIHFTSLDTYMAPKRSYIEQGVLDYPVTVFYFVVKRDFKTIVYWESRIGVFPVGVPHSIFSANNQVIMEPTSTIEYRYSIRTEPCTVEVLNDFNSLSRLGRSIDRLRKTKDGMQVNNVLARYPYITAKGSEYIIDFYD